MIDDPGANLIRMLMPAIALGTGFAAVLMRQTRSGDARVAVADYVRTARAKGLPSARSSAPRPEQQPDAGRDDHRPPARAPISGAVVTEQIFVLPGFGKLTIDAVSTRDYPVVQGVVLLTAVATSSQPPGRRVTRS